jgi:hypothetical protein
VWFVCRSILAGVEPDTAPAAITANFFPEGSSKPIDVDSGARVLSLAKKR